jgi:hypothetical protein
MDDDFEWDDPTREPDVGELLLSRTEDGRVRMKVRFDREAADIVEQAIEKMAATLPRDAATTDEQHCADAFLAILRWDAENRRGRA